MIALIAQSDLGGLPDTATNVGSGLQSLVEALGVVAICAVLLIGMFKAKSWEALAAAVGVVLVALAFAGGAPDLSGWAIDFGQSMAASLRSGG